MHLGHTNGTVSLWSPNVQTPLVKMLVHKGPVNAVVMDPSGKYMVSSGMDGQLKLWDIRMYKQVNQFFTPTPATSLAISQRGLLAAAHGPRISMYHSVASMAATASDKVRPYLTHMQPSCQISQLQFTPHQDTLVYTHTKGVASILVPGSSNPNYDASESNPYQTVRQRQEQEVKMLLEKIQPDTITLDFASVGKRASQQGHVDAGNVGGISSEHTDVIKEKRAVHLEAVAKLRKDKPDAYKAKGRSSTMKRFLKKQVNVVDEKKMLLKAKIEQEYRDKKGIKAQDDAEEFGALARFRKHSRNRN